MRGSISIRHPIGPNIFNSWTDDFHHVVGELVIGLVFLQVVELASLVDTFIQKIFETNPIFPIWLRKLRYFWKGSNVGVSNPQTRTKIGSPKLNQEVVHKLR